MLTLIPEDEINIEVEVAPSGNIKIDLLSGNCIEVLKTLPDESIDCCVTSPPYYGLRDYGSDAQIGLEDTPEKYVEKLVVVFREVRRTLKKTGTLWLNLGDSYASNWGMGAKRKSSWWSTASEELEGKGWGTVETAIKPNSFKSSGKGLKVKDLIGIPWMTAFALRADGWWLRQDIIWAKGCSGVYSGGSTMPESVTDRFTKSHEYLFLLSKSAKYYFDQESVKENKGVIGIRHGAKVPLGNVIGEGRNDRELFMQDKTWNGRNRRSVWTINPEPTKEAHFATFPTALIVPCIKAGCPKDGTVIDPFLGSGTTAMVSRQLGRNCIGIELNPEYLKIAKRRINNF